MNPGLIGAWSPGIGDPSVSGWLGVFLYAWAAIMIWWLLRRSATLRGQDTVRERRFWQLLLVALVLLGLNKQLDLQTALTELGRAVAHTQGWYAERHQVQQAFIAAGAMVGLIVLATACYLVSGARTSTHTAMLGGALLVFFVLARAASFHHVDKWLGHGMAGARFGRLLEFGGLLLIGMSAWRRRGPH